MRILIALIIGIALGAVGLYFYNSKQGQSQAHKTGEQLENAAKSARDTIEDKIKALNLNSNNIKEELERTGRVVRSKAKQAGQAIADATADARITAAIKAKLLA